MPDDILKTNYPLLVRALANIVICYVPGQGAWFTTMERGHYGVEATNGQHELAEGVVERLTPLALSKLVIDNDFLTDLEPELWEGDENTSGDPGGRASGWATSTCSRRRSRSRSS